MQAITRTVHIDGQPVSFKRLSLEDLFTVGEQIAAKREKTARDVAKEEKLEVSDAEVDARMEKLATDSGVGVDVVKKQNIKLD